MNRRPYGFDNFTAKDENPPVLDLSINRRFSPNAEQEAQAESVKTTEDTRDPKANPAMLPEREKNLPDLQKLKPLLNVPVEITVVLGQISLTIGQLLELQEGAVLELDREIGSEADICVNGDAVAKGELMIENGRMGIVITRILEDGENRCG
mgnify:CR=1 FL=1